MAFFIGPAEIKEIAEILGPSQMARIGVPQKEQIGTSTSQPNDTNLKLFELIAQTSNLGTTCIGIHIAKWTVFGNSMKRFVDEVPSFWI